MKKCLSILVMFLFIVVYGYTQQNQSIIIDYIHSDALVVDEWKNPGLYSPVNILDGDINTSYAQRPCQGFRYSSIPITLTIRFKNPVTFDEIRIMNGFGRNEELFKKNNRIKKMLIGVSPIETGKYDNDPEEESVSFQDIKEFQSVKLSKMYSAKQVRFITEEIFKGTKYNDTCITELEFYNKSQKIDIMHVPRLKKAYITKIGRDITAAFSDKTYTFDTEGWNDTVDLSKDGSIKYHQSDSYGDPPINEIMPDKWKMENSRLYMRFNSKWILYNYAIVESNVEVRSVWNIILFTDLNDYIPENHPYKLYFKRRSDDYQFEMFTP